MFWTDYGQNPKIERASLNGEGRTSIVNSGLVWPNDIVVDFSTNKLYWVDSFLDKIETADYDGNNRRQIFYYSGIHPFGVSLLSTTLYWTDWDTPNGLLKMDKNSGSILGGYKVSGTPMGVALYDSSTQPAGMHNTGQVVKYRAIQLYLLFGMIGLDLYMNSIDSFLSS